MCLQYSLFVEREVSVVYMNAIYISESFLEQFPEELFRCKCEHIFFFIFCFSVRRSISILCELFSVVLLSNGVWIQKDMYMHSNSEKYPKGPLIIFLKGSMQCHITVKHKTGLLVPRCFICTVKSQNPLWEIGEKHAAIMTT